MNTKLIIFLILTPSFVLDAYAGSATWKLNPQNSNWNTAGNWTPGTVPNGPADTATFAVSNNSAVSVMSTTEVEGIVFNPGASAFSITSSSNVVGTVTLTISGTGVTNNSGIEQNFVATGDFFNIGEISFTNGATAGQKTIYTATTNILGNGTNIRFFDNARAGSSTFVLEGPAPGGDGAGQVYFAGNCAARTRLSTTRDPSCLSTILPPLPP